MLTVIESQRELIYQCAALNEGDPYQLVEVRLVAGKELMKRRLQAFKWWSLPPAVGGGTRSKIVKSMAKQGVLSATFSGSVVRAALVSGLIPENYELHHNQPLALDGSNKKKNYRLIHRKAHTLLHKYVLDPMQKILQSEQVVPTHSKKVYLKMPLLPVVVRPQDVELFLTAEEIEVEKEYLREKVKTTKKIMYEKERKKPKVVTNHATGRGQRGYGKRRQGHTR